MKLDENFNQQDFIEWIEEFLPDFSIDIRKVDVPGGFAGVKSINTIGESGLNVRVYIIETNADPSRRKVGLTTDSFNLLKNYGSPNAIIAYYSKDEPLWRISLLTSTPVWSEGKVITKLSNPKRQSYVLGSNAKIKTPYQYLLSRGKITDFTDLKSRFSLEVVNKEFYKEISQAFTKLVGGSVANGKSKKSFEPFLKLPSLQDLSQTNLEFAVRLIGRIIFCWFLREKRSETGQSLIPKELVSFEAANTTEDYYHKTLEPIFFEILNKTVKSRKPSFINDLFSAIPYLNGGLFSPHEDDYFSYNEEKQAINHNTVVIPNEWLKSFFEVLETYNFTIDENTSFDEELSIDPEMLGRIFENLLAEINPETGESARKSTGSYYTPRVIVDYMIDESLLLYLKEKTGIEENKLRSLISYDLEDDKSNPLNEDEKDNIAQALGSIKILDPACGSGAFPIGALQKIVFILQQIDQNGQLWFKKQIQNTPVELRQVLEREFKEKNFDYIRKLGIIRENIYGIDIQPIATEISRLRCFLTLVVDERINDSLENRGIEPLPNLDFKFVTANSLIGLPKIKLNQQDLFDDNAKIDQLKSLRDQYFTAKNEERKDIMIEFSELQSEMINELIDVHSYIGVTKAELTRKLTDWKPFKHKSSDWFDPEWMFGIKDGFDIVIANPPYGIVYDKENKSYLESAYSTFKRNNDIYVAFYERGVQFLKEYGFLTYISPNTFLNGDYFTKLRKVLSDSTQLEIITDYKDLNIFADPTVFVCIFVCKKDSHINYPYTYNHRISTENADSFFSTAVEINQSTNKFKPTNPILSKALTNPEFEIVDDLFYVKDVGFNYWTVGKGKKRDGDSIGDRILYNGTQLNTNDKPFLKGRNIEKYYHADPNNYLKHNYAELLRQNDTFRFSKDFLEIYPKIIYRQTSNKIIATIDTQSLFLDKTVHMIAPKDPNKNIDLRYLLALLNSSLFNYFYNYISQETEGRTFSQVKTTYIKQLPIKIISTEQQTTFVKIVDEILQITRSHDYLKNSIKEEKVKENEKQINQLVYKLYDLKPEEIALVEKVN